MNAVKITENHDLNVAFEIRKSVFVEEQGVPLVDKFDQFYLLDGLAKHILAY